MATQLGLYNGALRLLKERRLATITDNVPARYLLDDAYAGALAHCLEMGQWNFASRSTSIAASASANRGYSQRYAKPSDFVRLISISASASYYPPLEAYDEDATYWYADEATLYITYVSDDASYGGSLTLWPESYGKVVEAYLANEIGPHLTKSDDILKRIEYIFDKALNEALAKDGINRTVRTVSGETLGIYREALRMVGKRLITNFDDLFIRRRIADVSGEPETEQSRGRSPMLPADDAEMELTLRRLLDEAYDDAVLYLLEQGLWNHASRTVKMEAETDTTPEFGFNYVFERPADYVRLVAISDTEDMWPTLDDYAEEGDYIYANTDLLYMSYVSDGADYGLDDAKWPPTFKKALSAYLAREIAPAARLSAAKIEMIDKEYMRRLKDARTKDAMDQAIVRPPPGRLVRSRSGSRYRFNDQRRAN